MFEVRLSMTSVRLRDRPFNMGSGGGGRGGQANFYLYKEVEGGKRLSHAEGGAQQVLKRRSLKF